MIGKQNMRHEAEAERSAKRRIDLTAVLIELLDRYAAIASFVGFGAEPYVPPRPGWLLPVLLEDGDLDWARYDGELALGRKGMREPVGPRLGVDAITACDVVLVPALRVDRAGYRLGRGGGSYDRALARATGLTVALVHDDEVVEAVPHEAHDVPVRAFAAAGQGLVVLR